MIVKVGIIGTGYFSMLDAKILSGITDVQITSIFGASIEKENDNQVKLTLKILPDLRGLPNQRGLFLVKADVGE